MQPLDDLFVQQLKDALSHLYDQSYLQLHPFTALLTAAGVKVSLHRLLCELIEELRPPAHLAQTDPAWRSYQALYLRYVEGIEVTLVAEMLTISPRQFRREHQKGLHALAHRVHQSCAASTSPSSKSLETEIEWLTAHRDVGDTPVIDVMESVLATLADLVTQRGISLVTVGLSTLPPVHIERVLLRQVLLNALTHLLAQSADTEIVISGQYVEERVSITLCATAGDAPKRRLMGADDGEEAEEELEDRLAVAAQLIEMRNGAITYCARPYPIIRLHLPTHHTSTILIVDDNPDVIRLFCRYLSDTTHNVRSATTSSEAFQLAKEMQPSAIVLDVMMPNQDGWEILQYLKHQPTMQHIPVIICSVLNEQALAQSLGAAHFLAKPVTQQALLSALAKVLTAPPMNQAAARHPTWP